jgi:hypothetical protein
MAALAGPFGDVSDNLQIDGCTARNATGDPEHLGRLQMLNHSCNPNGKMIAITLGPGLELFVIEALDDRSEPTFNYDAYATERDKANYFASGDGSRPSAQCPRACY